MSQDLLPDWVMNTFEELASKAPFGSGRVQLGFAFDGLWLPKDVLVPLFEKVKAMDVRTITSHYLRNPIIGQWQHLLFINLKLLLTGWDNSWISNRDLTQAWYT
jgi:hypothetical protein